MSQNGSVSKQPKLADELSMFDDVFPTLINDLEKLSVTDPETKDAIDWFKKVALYNVPHGKKNRGLSVVSTYRHLVSQPSESHLKIARILGWSIEFLQAFFLVADDIMDQSITRRGRPCWYKTDGVSLTAINDSLFLENFVYKTIKKYLKEQSYYINVLELFLEVSFRTVTGQCLDLITSTQENAGDFSQFTSERYSAIVKWKTAFYSFYLPVALALHMAGISDEESHEQAKFILLKMGHFFQVQDDFLDCYGKPEVIGKVGTDIEENKCGWLIVKALEIASAEQIEILKKNYGQKDESSVAKVKSIYHDLGLEKVYQQYEEDCYAELLKHIEEACDKLPKEIFMDFAKKIFKRNK